MGDNNVNRVQGKDHLYDTLAGKMARDMDAADGNKNGWIDADVWNIFAEEAGGKKIKEKISTRDAMNSITTYCVREAAEDLDCANGTAKAREWYDDPKLGDCFESKKSSSGDASGVNGADGAGSSSSSNSANNSGNTSGTNNSGNVEIVEVPEQNTPSADSTAVQNDSVPQIQPVPSDSTAVQNNENIPAEETSERKSWSERVDEWWGRTAGHDIVSGEADDGKLTGGDIAKSVIRGVPKMGVEMAAHPVESAAGIVGTVAISALAGKAAVAMGLAASAGPVGWIVGAAIGLAFAGFAIYQGVKASKEAKTDAQAKQGYEDIGVGVTTAIMSAFGLRKGVKGIKANSPAAKAVEGVNKPIEQPKVVELKGTKRTSRTELGNDIVEEVKTVEDKPVSKSKYKVIKDDGKVSSKEITIEEYGYDAKGNKVQTKTTEYAFDKDGKPVVGEDGKQVIKSQTIENTTPEGKTTSKQTFKPNKKTGKMELDTETRYNDKGQRVSEKTRSDSSVDKDIITEYEPETQKPIREVSFNNKDNRAYHVFEDMSENGKWTKKTSFDKKGRKEAIYEFDENGKATGAKGFDKKGRRINEIMECGSEEGSGKRTMYRKNGTAKETVEYVNSKEAKRTYYDKTGKKVTKVEVFDEKTKTWKTGELKDASDPIKLPETPKDPKFSPRDLRIAKRDLRRSLKDTKKSDDEKFNTILEDIKKQGNAEQQKELTKMVDDRKAELAKAEKKAAEKAAKKTAGKETDWVETQEADGSFKRTKKLANGDTVEETLDSNKVLQERTTKTSGGDTIEESFYNDKLQSKNIKLANGDVIKESYHNGKISGRDVYSNGKLIEQQDYIDGKLWTVYKSDPITEQQTVKVSFTDNKVKDVELYKDGKPNIRTDYLDDGSIEGIFEYDAEGKSHWTTDPDKVAKLATKYEDAVKMGEITEYKPAEASKSGGKKSAAGGEKPAAEGEKPAEGKKKPGLFFKTVSRADDGSYTRTRRTLLGREITKTYDSKGNLTSKTYYDIVKGKITDHYEYFDGERELKSRDIWSDVNENRIFKTEEYSMNGKNKVTKVTEYGYESDGKQFIDSITINETRPNGTWAKRTCIDGNGKLYAETVFDENNVALKNTIYYEDGSIEVRTGWDPKVKKYNKIMHYNEDGWSEWNLQNDGTSQYTRGGLYGEGGIDAIPERPANARGAKPAVASEPSASAPAAEEPIELPNIFEEIPAEPKRDFSNPFAEEPKPEPVVETPKGVPAQNKGVKLPDGFVQTPDDCTALDGQKLHMFRKSGGTGVNSDIELHSTDRTIGVRLEFKPNGDPIYRIEITNGEPHVYTEWDNATNSWMNEADPAAEPYKGYIARILEFLNRK